jgi:dipeptidyl aminopeptidase/acylaminoacyl peptidase
MAKMKRRNLIIGIAALVIILLGAGYLAVGTAIYARLSGVQAKCAGHPEDTTNTPASFTREGFDATPYLTPEYEEVSFPSRDPAMTISGFYLSAQGVDPAAAPAVVVVHGINDCKRRPFVLTAGGMLSKNGVNALLIDLRDHGDSTIEDGRMAAGTEEYRDVLGAWDWLVSEKNIPQPRIGLMGFSLGAATVLIAAGEEPRVAAVWEDSSYGSIDKMIDSELARLGMPSFLTPGGIFMGKLLAQDDITALTPLQEAAKLGSRPVFIVHGDADERANVQHAYDLAKVINDNGGKVEPWIAQGSQHIEAIFDHTAEYERKLSAFFREHLS